MWKELTVRTNCLHHSYGLAALKKKCPDTNLGRCTLTNDTQKAQQR
jgi:hypothetical protein